MFHDHNNFRGALPRCLPGPIEDWCPPFDKPAVDLQLKALALRRLNDEEIERKKRKAKREELYAEERNCHQVFAPFTEEEWEKQRRGLRNLPTCSELAVEEDRRRRRRSLSDMAQKCKMSGAMNKFVCHH